MPASLPTLAEVRDAKSTKVRAELLQSMPLVRIQGGTVDVDVQNTVDVEVHNRVDVEVQNTVDVDVQNTPLSVEVNR